MSFKTATRREVSMHGTPSDCFLALLFGLVRWHRCQLDSALATILLFLQRNAAGLEPKHL